MKAQIKPRINLDNRTKLQDVIPLETPLNLFIDPCNICNFKCKFCPNGDSKLIKDTNRKQTIMDFNVYKKIIDDLKEFDKPLNTIHLYKEGEPLLNKHLPDMIKYAKESNSIKYVDTTTNGYLLSPKVTKSIINSGLDRINISMYGMSDEQFLKFTGVKINFEKYVNNIINLYENKGNCEICIKITGDFITEEEKIKFFDTFGDYTDRIFIENAAPCWVEFDVEKRLGIKITKGIYNNPITYTNICPYIFYMVSINSDGTVSLCFLDWKRKLIIGDIKKQSLKEIWNSNELFKYQVEHISGNRKNINVCKHCSQLSHCLPDNIDLYADDILKRLI